MKAYLWVIAVEKRDDGWVKFLHPHWSRPPPSLPLTGPDLKRGAADRTRQPLISNMMDTELLSSFLTVRRCVARAAPLPPWTWKPAPLSPLPPAFPVHLSAAPCPSSTLPAAVEEKPPLWRVEKPLCQQRQLLSSASGQVGNNQGGFGWNEPKLARLKSLQTVKSGLIVP